MLWGIGRVAASIVTALAVTISSVPVSTADDLSSLSRDVASGADFRLRVGAALSLGKSKSRAALAPLVAALDDPSPAVRVAAAAALGVLGHKDAIEALRTHLTSESSQVVRSQLKGAIEKLQGGREGDERAARVLVKLGQLKNLTGVRGLQLIEVFRGATRANASALPGVEVLSDATEGKHESEARKLPLLVLDGVVNQLAQGSSGTQVTVSAQVEFVFRKMPEHALTGSITGAARARDSSKILQDQTLVAQLENQALQGAVESAMRGAPEVMQHALR
jgi:HEAT repeats